MPANTTEQASNAFTREPLDQMTELEEQPNPLQMPKDQLQTSDLAEHTGFLSLPPELLVRIFSGIDRRSDISSLRLVCHLFKELSSPFLLTKVVLAKRMDVVQRLYDVMEHPYFHKHVTELVYDASFHAEDLVKSLPDYSAAYALSRNCRQSGVRRTSAWEEEERQYNSMWTRMIRNATLRGSDVSSQKVKPSYGGYLENGVERESEDERAIRQTLYHGTPNHWHMYVRRWLAERSMEQDNSMQWTLRNAYAQFPKLQHITFSDFRCLSRSEDYHALRQRLFGDSLEPVHLSSKDYHEGWDEFWVLRSSVGELPADKRVSFSIGPNAYWKPPCNVTHFRSLDNDYMGQIAVPLSCITSSGDQPGKELTLNKAFKHIRRLRLPVMPPPDTLEQSYDEERLQQSISTSLIPTLFQSCAQNLRSLRFFMEDLVVFNRSSKCYDLWTGQETGDIVLQSLLFAVYFLALEHLDIRGWCFDVAPCQNFLWDHAATLKQLRFVDNILRGDDKGLAEWVGEHMTLQGVAICNRSELSPPPYTILRTRRDYEGAGRLLRSDAVTATLEKKYGKIERVWLQGRQNALRGAGDWRRAESWVKG